MRQPLAAWPLRGVVAAAIAAAMIPAAALATGEEPVQESKVVKAQPTTTQRSSGEWAQSFEGLRHFTQPSRDAVMGFSFPTEVREVKVKGGDRVKAGDLLVRAWDTEALASVRQQERRAKYDFDVQKAVNQRDLAQIEFDALDGARGSITEQEWKRAKFTLDGANIAVEAAREQLEDQKAALERLMAELERYRLVAPFDGQIESVKLDVGAIVAESQPVVRVVNTDRLWTAVPTPTDQVMSLGIERDDPAWVLMDTPEDPVVLVGRVIEVSPVAEFASQKTIVKVEFENPRGRPAGLAAWVRFVEPTGEWAGRIWSGERVGDVRGDGR